LSILAFDIERLNLPVQELNRQVGEYSPPPPLPPHPFLIFEETLFTSKSGEVGRYSRLVPVQIFSAGAGADILGWLEHRPRISANSATFRGERVSPKIRKGWGEGGISPNLSIQFLNGKV
jgi:hypothetical protein